MNVDELEARIAYYAMKYYSGEPEISDDQFDSLVNQLRQLNPNSSVLSTGWGFEVIEDKVKHKYTHIGSLDKAKTYDEIPDRFKDKTIYISPKLDGLSAVAYYKNGKLVKGVTRGNGEYGKDITLKLYKILGDKINDINFTGAVRGELIISNNNWTKLQQKYDNLIAPRNFVAGIINRKEIDEDINFVDLVVYKIVGQENRPVFSDRQQVIFWLNSNFKHSIPEYYYPVLNEASWSMYHDITFEQFKQMGYGLDGLVLTDPIVQYNSQTMGYVYNEEAFKFPAETTTTTIKEIQWELSRTQRLIPVAVVEPVELSGAIVERATCNNAQWVKEMQLGAEAEVEITRSNEVIPQILTVLQPSSEPLPERCPICDSELVWDGVDLKCNNSLCQNIKSSDLQQWCESVGETDGLQFTIMKQYLDKYGIVDIVDLYNKQQLVLDDLYSKKLTITETKILEFFNKLYLDAVPIEKALIGLNIPRLGEKTAKLLSSRKDLIDSLVKMATQSIYTEVYDWIYTQLVSIVKEATTISICNNLSKFRTLRYLYDSYFEKSRLIYQDVKSNIKYVAVTGSLNTMKRKDFEKFISEYGYELNSNLKKCEYLITNNPDSGSTKNKQARDIGIKIITEEEFLNSLKKLN